MTGVGTAAIGSGGPVHGGSEHGGGPNAVSMVSQYDGSRSRNACKDWKK